MNKQAGAAQDKAGKTNAKTANAKGSKQLQGKGGGAKQGQGKGKKAKEQ